MCVYDVQVYVCLLRICTRQKDQSHSIDTYWVLNNCVLAHGQTSSSVLIPGSDCLVMFGYYPLLLFVACFKPLSAMVRGSDNCIHIIMELRKPAMASNPGYARSNLGPILKSICSCWLVRCNIICFSNIHTSYLCRCLTLCSIVPLIYIWWFPYLIWALVFKCFQYRLIG